MDTVDKKITDVRITDVKLKKDGITYLLDVELDCRDNKSYIKNLLLCDTNKALHNITITTDYYNMFPYKLETSYISGLFEDKLELIGGYCLTKKEKEMTLEEIEKELGYPVKIVKEK
nr:hypothetical protein [uncultured Lachnoclostridium sp.]